MIEQYSWGDDMISVDQPNHAVALESFTSGMTQGSIAGPPHPFFKPINIVTEQGIHYATIYACKAVNGTTPCQQVAMWLAGLKETDQVHLTVSSLILDVPLFAILDLMAALSSTKAKINIYLDQIVSDGLAYFYLIADTIVPGHAGGMYIPSYADQREQDASGPWKAMHDFYKWVVSDATDRQLLTPEEADKLHRGSHVVIPMSRFAA